MSDDVLIEVDHASKKFCRSLKRALWYGVRDIGEELFGRRNVDRHDLRAGEFWAADDVSFKLRRGECLGLIGPNGAGKSTLLKMLNGLIKPDRGRIAIRGRVGALIELGTGFNPILTGRENIYNNAAVLGISKREVDRKLEAIIAFAELPGDAIDAPVQSFSSGMKVRLGFAVAAHMEPDVLLIDEVLAVGDAGFRNRCYQRIGKLREKTAVIFVSHAMSHVARICDRAAVMLDARMAHLGDIDEAIALYEARCAAASDQEPTFLSCLPPIADFSADVPRRVKSGAPLRIDLRLDAAEAIGPLILKVLFYSRAGEIAAECALDSEEQGIASECRARSWNVAIESLPLRSGTYRVAFNLLNRRGDVLVWSYKRHELAVEGAAGGLSDCQLRGVWCDESELQCERGR